MDFLKFLILTSLLGFNAYSANLKSGDGTFHAEKDDSVQFIKDQLIHNSLKDVVSKELTEIGLDKDVFWQKYDEKFEARYQKIRENVELKYKLGEKELSKDEKEKLFKNLRLKRLNLKLKFVDFFKLVKSYSIKKLYRSSENPSIRHIKLEAELDKKQVYSLYYQFFHGSTQRNIRKIILSYRIVNKKDAWNALGVKSKTVLIDVLKENWMKWFKENPNFSDKEFEIIEGDDQEELSKGVYAKNYFEDGDGEDYSGAFWIEILIEINPLEKNKLVGSNLLEYKGDIIIHDLENRNVLLSESFERTTQRYYFHDEHKMASEIATYIYRMPLNEFHSLHGLIKKLKPLSDQKKLLVKNITNISELLNIKGKLEKLGVVLSLKPEIVQIQSSLGLINIRYIGDREKLSDLLLKLNNSLVGSKTLKIEDPENPLVMNLTNGEKANIFVEDNNGADKR